MNRDNYSNSDTPETDAAFTKYNTPPYNYGMVELREEMQRIERERDAVKTQPESSREHLLRAVTAVILGLLLALVLIALAPLIWEWRGTWEDDAPETGVMTLSSKDTVAVRISTGEIIVLPAGEIGLRVNGDGGLDALWITPSEDVMVLPVVVTDPFLGE